MTKQQLKLQLKELGIMKSLGYKINKDKRYQDLENKYDLPTYNFKQELSKD
jgi:hypothetical protein